MRERQTNCEVFSTRQVKRVAILFLLCLLIDLSFSQCVGTEIKTRFSDGIQCTQILDGISSTITAAIHSLSNTVFHLAKGSSSSVLSHDAHDESGTMTSDVVNGSLPVSILSSSTLLSSETGTNQQNTNTISLKGMDSGSTPNRDARPAWFSYLVTLNNVVNGLSIAYFSLVYERSNRRFHGILVRDFFSQSEKKYVFFVRGAAYALICLTVLFAVENCRICLIITSIISCLITGLMLWAQHNYVYMTGNWQKAQSEKRKLLGSLYFGLPISEEKSISKLNALYLKPDLQNSTHMWTGIIVKSIAYLAADVEKNQYLWRSDDIVFFLRCGYLGWVEKFKLKLQERNGSNKKQANENATKTQPEGGCDSSYKPETEEFEALLKLSGYWDYFCMFQEVQHSLINAIFNKSYSVDRIRLILDTVGVFKKALNLDNRSSGNGSTDKPANEDAVKSKTPTETGSPNEPDNSIRKLLFQLTIFLTYTNMLIHLVSHKQEELLYYLADGMIVPPTTKMQDSEKEIGLLFDWLKTYAVLLHVQSKMKKIKEIEDKGKDSQEKQEVKELEKKLENEMIQLQLQFEFTAVSERFDLLRYMYPLGIQQPLIGSKNTDISSGGKANDKQATKPLWYSSCILYHQQTKANKGGEENEL